MDQILESYCSTANRWPGFVVAPASARVPMVSTSNRRNILMSAFEAGHHCTAIVTVRLGCPATVNTTGTELPDTPAGTAALIW